MPSRERVFSSTQRMERSSSTIQTGFMICWLILLSEQASDKQNSGLFYGQAQGEGGMPGPAGAIDGPMMVVNEILSDGQTQTAPPFASGNQRIEHTLPDIVGNTRPVVDHLDLHGQPITFLGQRHLAQRTGLEHDLTCAIHGLRGVAGDVENCLDQLLP